jgi:pyruvate,orthophosphate dikinase
MTKTLGLPVPPRFTITTEACWSYLRSGWPAGLDEALRGGIARLEAALDRGFGHTPDPLLVSARTPTASGRGSPTTSARR